MVSDLVLKNKLKAVHDLIKTELPIAAGVCVFAGMIISGQKVSLLNSLLGVLTGFFLSGTAMITNDYWDLEVDRINHPNRPLPSGRITVRELWIIATVFSILGLTSAFFLGHAAFAFSIFVWVIGILYNWKYKESGLLGNIMVSTSVASTFILGGIANGGLYSGLVWVFGIIAFVFDLAEEIASDVMDMEGDAKRGSKSIARIRGRNYALNVSTVSFIFVIVLTFIPYLNGWLGLGYLIPVLFLNLVIAFNVYGLNRSTSIKEGRAKLRALYLSMLVFVVIVILQSLLLF